MFAGRRDILRAAKRLSGPGLGGSYCHGRRCGVFCAMKLEALSALDAQTLRALARLLAAYPIERPPVHRIEQAVPGGGEGLKARIRDWIEGGWSTAQLADAAEALALAKEAVIPTPGLEFVLSGPTVSRVPTRD